MHRFRFVLYRPLQLLPVLFGISIVSFVLVHAIPGDPVRAIISPKATPEVVERVRAPYGLDQPVVVQYLKFLENLGQGGLFPVSGYGEDLRGHLGMDGNQNFQTFYKGEKAAELVAQGRVELDPDKSRAIYCELQAIAKEDVPWIDLSYSPFRNISRTNVHDLVQNPLGRFMLETTWVDE